MQIQQVVYEPVYNYPGHVKDQECVTVFSISQWHSNWLTLVTLSDLGWYNKAINYYFIHKKHHLHYRYEGYTLLLMYSRLDSDMIVWKCKLTTMQYPMALDLTFMHQSCQGLNGDEFSYNIIPT